MPFEIKDGILKKYTEEPGVTAVTVPDGVTGVGNWAFSDCTHLTAVILPDSVTHIGTKAFYHCAGLTEIRVPARVTEIGEGAFQYCTALTEAVLPDGLTAVSAAMFFGCTRLKRIRIPDSVKQIGMFAFRQTALTEISISAGADGMVEAFSETPWLAAKRKEHPLVIVNGILIDAKACSGAVVIPDGVKQIHASAFSGCEALTEITVPAGITEIADKTFSRCTALQTAALPDGLETIGSEAFRECDNLTALLLPESVTRIGNAAFSDCWRLAVIRLHPDDPALYRAYDANTEELSAELAKGLAMLRNKAYDADVVCTVKSVFLFLHWLHIHDEALTAYLRNHPDDFMQESIFSGDICVIEAFAKADGFFTAENIGKYIDMAQECEQNEIFMFLLNYKNTHFGFDSTAKLHL